MKAVILFGHGARDIRWREPFDRLAELWRTEHNSTPVELAFLEIMQPSLEEAVSSLANVGVTHITVVPVFFGQGGHLRNDLPLLLAGCQQKFPAIKIIATHPVGEEDDVLRAILDFAKKVIT